MIEAEVIKWVAWLFLLICVGWAIFGIFDEIHNSPENRQRREDEEIDRIYREMYGKEKE